jgi:hypothetical protein
VPYKTNAMLQSSRQVKARPRCLLRLHANEVCSSKSACTKPVNVVTAPVALVVVGPVEGQLWAQQAQAQLP